MQAHATCSHTLRICSWQDTERCAAHRRCSTVCWHAPARPYKHAFYSLVLTERLIALPRASTAFPPGHPRVQAAGGAGLKRALAGNAADNAGPLVAWSAQLPHGPKQHKTPQKYPNTHRQIPQEEPSIHRQMPPNDPESTDVASPMHYKSINAKPPVTTSQHRPCRGTCALRSCGFPLTKSLAGPAQMQCNADLRPPPHIGW